MEIQKTSSGLNDLEEKGSKLRNSYYFKVYYKSAIIKTIWSWKAYPNRSIEQTREHRNGLTDIPSFDS